MKSNINYRRVRQIKAGIYLVLLMMLIIPAILMIIVGVKILSRIDSPTSTTGLGALESPALAGAPGASERSVPDNVSESSLSPNAQPHESETSQLLPPESSSAAQSAQSSGQDSSSGGASETSAQAGQASGGPQAASSQPEVATPGASGSAQADPTLDDEQSEQIAAGGGETLEGQTYTEQSGMDQTGSGATGSEISYQYGDQEIPNTGFPKPGEPGYEEYLRSLS